MTMTVIAKEIGAAVVSLEHRYFGKSIPFEELNGETWQYMTVDNAIGDLVNFAETGNLPFDPYKSSQASKVPWMYIGGSYAGALAGWMEQLSPGTFWAYWASSAPVQAIDNFWEYSQAAIDYIPHNCSVDVSAIFAHVDDVLMHGNPDDKKALKSRFNGLSSADDTTFANAIDVLALPFQYELYNEGQRIPSHFFMCSESCH